MDLWVIATVFVDREITGKPLNDLDDWISYAPFRSEDQKRTYQIGIDLGYVTKLNPYTLSAPIREGGHGGTGTVRYIDENEYKFLGRSLLAEFIFSFADKTNTIGEGSAFHSGNKSDDGYPLDIFQLPSTALHKFVADNLKGKVIVGNRSFGQDPPYIRLSIEKAVENNESALKSALKTSRSGESVSIDSNHLIYFL